MQKHIKKILTEMCKRVNVKFKDINFKEEDWFMKYSWTREEEESFIQWMITYLINNKKARYEIMQFPFKKSIEKVVCMFVLNYGWTTKKLSK